MCVSRVPAVSRPSLPRPANPPRSRPIARRHLSSYSSSSSSFILSTSAVCRPPPRVQPLASPLFICIRHRQLRVVRPTYSSHRSRAERFLSPRTAYGSCLSPVPRNSTCWNIILTLLALYVLLYSDGSICCRFDVRVSYRIVSYRRAIESFRYIAILLGGFD